MKHIGKPRAVTWIDIDRLTKLSREADGTIVVECAVGDTLIEESAILRVHGAKSPIAEEELRRSIRLGEQRTFEQDPKYALRLLVDIAIKALSPAINDPTTAVQAILQSEQEVSIAGQAVQAQRSTVADYLNGGNWSLVKEFV